MICKFCGIFNKGARCIRCAMPLLPYSSPIGAVIAQQSYTEPVDESPQIPSLADLLPPREETPPPTKNIFAKIGLGFSIAAFIAAAVTYAFVFTIIFGIDWSYAEEQILVNASETIMTVNLIGIIVSAILCIASLAFNVIGIIKFWEWKLKLGLEIFGIIFCLFILLTLVPLILQIFPIN